MSHTPGPWNVSKSSMARLIYADEEQAFDLAIVCNGGNDNQTDANANLIAAAPDMLAALQRCVSLLSIAVIGSDTSTFKSEARLLAIAAIAKAKGEII